MTTCCMPTAPCHAVAAELKRRVEGRGGARTADAILEVMDAWRRWAVGLHWIVEAALFAGVKGELSVVSGRWI